MWNLISRKLKQVKNILVKALGGVTEGEYWHAYRRTKTMTAYHTVRGGQVFHPKGQSPQELMKFVLSLNNGERWLAIPVEDRKVI